MGAKYPQCFDLSNEHATLNGAIGDVGYKTVALQFMKCGEKDSLFDLFLTQPQTTRCRSKSYIDKWLSDKYISVLLKENWVDYDDFEKPLKPNYRYVINEKLSKKNIVKEVKLIQAQA